VLKPLHESRLIEYEAENARARISPKGAIDAEERLLRPTGG
jgi:hypothetical protein